MAKHHHFQREASKLRKLRKQDKRAAAILIAAHRYKPKSFADGCDGRWSYWNCDYWGEWDECPAHSVWLDFRFDEHPNAMAWWGLFAEDSKAALCKDRPRGLRLHERRKWYALRAPAGYRRRGRRVVPVDKTGAMVREKGQA